tara:strand:+ start:1994 stop:2155 length:162 start_codon:yes stop_codon:yes gene_type:complete
MENSILQSPAEEDNALLADLAQIYEMTSSLTRIISRQYFKKRVTPFFRLSWMK